MRPCYYYHSLQIFLPFHWLRTRHVTCKKLLTNNGLLMRNVVQLCLAANNILLMRKWNQAFSFLRSLLRENGRSLRFPKIFIKNQTRWSKDKTIIELGCRKISWFFSVLQINYLPQPSVSAYKICSSLTNHDTSLTFVQQLLITVHSKYFPVSDWLKPHT